MLVISSMCITSKAHSAIQKQYEEITVIEKENEELLKEIENKAFEVIVKELKNKKFNYTELKNQIVNEISPFIMDRTGRKPIVLPVIMDIKNSD